MKFGRVSDRVVGNWKCPTAVSVEPEARYCKQLTVCRTQISTECQHRRPGHSSVIGARLFRPQWTVTTSLKNTRLRMSSQWSLLCSIVPKPRSNFRLCIAVIYNSLSSLSLSSNCKWRLLLLKKAQNICCYVAICSGFGMCHVKLPRWILISLTLISLEVCNTITAMSIINVVYVFML